MAHPLRVNSFNRPAQWRQGEETNEDPEISPRAAHMLAYDEIHGRHHEEFLLVSLDMAEPGFLSQTGAIRDLSEPPPSRCPL